MSDIKMISLPIDEYQKLDAIRDERDRFKAEVDEAHVDCIRLQQEINCLRMKPCQLPDCVEVRERFSISGDESNKLYLKVADERDRLKAELGEADEALAAAQAEGGGLIQKLAKLKAELASYKKDWELQTKQLVDVATEGIKYRALCEKMREAFGSLVNFSPLTEIGNFFFCRYCKSHLAGSIVHKKTCIYAKAKEVLDAKGEGKP